MKLNNILLFPILIFALVSKSHGYQISWAEGKCDDTLNIYEGATRDFYNRGAAKPWVNKQGDWLDAKLNPQGSKSFTEINIKNKKKYDTVSIDGTTLAKYWQKNIIPNHGFLIKHVKNDKVIFFSKDKNSTNIQPTLQVKTHLRIYNLKPTADTELDLSTYRCLNDHSLLNSYHHLLLRFDLTNIAEEIISAHLQLTVAKDIANSSLNLYAVNIESNFRVKEFGLVDIYKTDQDLANDKHVLYYEDFSNDSWRDKWGLSYWGSYKTTNSNSREKFIPLNESALEITVEKGKHSGMSAHFFVKNVLPTPDTKLTSAYFRYNLQLGHNFKLSTGGKLPGFAGIYGDEDFRAGWGGRRSNGENGWSTRGMFSPTLSEKNPLANRTPIGNYIYHADMKYTYGDERAWNLDNISVLKNNTWYSIEQYVRMNNTGKNNGILKAWVNGILVYSRNNIRFTDNPLVGIESVWLDIYHGGSATAPRDLTLFIDDIVIASKYIGSRIHSEK